MKYAYNINIAGEFWETTLLKRGLQLGKKQQFRKYREYKLQGKFKSTLFVYAKISGIIYEIMAVLCINIKTFNNAGFFKMLTTNMHSLSSAI